jgi:hypothetical protein
LARRLTVFAALLLPLVIIWGISYNLKNSKKFSLAAVIIISCLLGLLAYRSGPVLPVSVSSADWQTAQLVWQEIKDDYNNYCVLGDLELLLPLEALSNKEVANGNFSWQENYVETARPLLYQKLISGGDYLIIDEALMASQKQYCVFAVRQDISATMPRQFINWLGQNLQSITSSDYLIWKK